FFKEKVKEINNNTIEYNMYSAIITTRWGQNSGLNIYLPNQWFYVASYFTDFYNELQKYKKVALTIVTKDRLKELNGEQLTQSELSTLNQLPLNTTSKEFLVKFITDYSWWKGAKTIDRGDFYVSPILSSAKLVNASQSFVADLCAFLADKDDLVKAIIDGFDALPNGNNVTFNVNSQSSNFSTILPLLTAIRTKPFILLAGISGTGKSRLVRKLAQASVSEDLQKMYDPKSVEGGFNRWQLHKPANFELIQVKPNWHNSLEVVGYKSNIGGAHYEFTPFVEFVARAWKHPETPFFLCLDEMNLAPVEQYFAEFLSAIESRSIENNEYETDPIIKPFESFDADNDTLSDRMIAHLLGKLDTQEKSNLADRFRTKGLTLPQNLIILGTVNMDETTFSFSRKVLDRAMSIVMDDVDYESYFNGTSENNVPEMDEGIKQLIINRHINGLESKDNDAEAVKNYLTSINAILDKTPFKLGYRAANEALLYVSAAHSINPETATNAALDEFTLMKILSRIEGDKRSIDNLLENLKGVITNADYPKSYEVLDTMSKTLNSKQFVSYWTK
ncbi:MAG: hypothetical protein J6U21_04900, partial [Bacteroidales bacterium]|nr:hypothetical protein [Bacteroidales bacterium]